MEQVDLLKDKGIRVTELHNKGYELIKHWGEAFAKDLTKNEKRQIDYGRFLWHALGSCKRGQSARNAFNYIMKDECYIFYQEFKNAYLLENASSLTSEDILNEYDGSICDVYVVDKDFTWTYIVTHEEDFGPYFYKPVIDPIFF
jgi:hypothetical protein